MASSSSSTSRQLVSIHNTFPGQVALSNFSRKHVMINSLRDMTKAGPRTAVGNVSDCRHVSDCRSRGHEVDPGPVPYFRGD